jgi:hypothetical protein
MHAHDIKFLARPRRSLLEMVVIDVWLHPTYSGLWEGLAMLTKMEQNRKFAVASLWLILSLLVVKAGGTCDINGQWYDATSTRNHQVSPARFLRF